MPEVTQILNQIQQGNVAAASDLLPLVYAELRRLARYRIRKEAPNQTLNPTALVHEAWMRLEKSAPEHWNNRNQFDGVAAEAMRRILVEQARRKQAEKRGGQSRRVPMDAAESGFIEQPDELLDIDEALTRLAAEDSRTARLIQLRYFAGLSIEDAAEVVGISRSTAYEHWSYARVRLRMLMDAE